MTQHSSAPDLAAARLVSVIIVNFNGMHFLEACLASLKSAFAHSSFEIIIVDNASSDGSQAWLQSRTDIVYIASQVNTGFTGGNNLGATHAKGDILLFINNDTQVQTPLDAMVGLLQDPGIGIAACRLQYGDGRQQFSFGYEHTPLRILCSWLGLEKRHTLPTLFRKLETDPASYLLHHPQLDWVSGACFAMRRSDWDAVAGFDTAYFMYCEDVDLCKRLRGLGLRIAYTPDCLVTHYEGAGKAWIGQTALRRTARSYQIFTLKHSGYGAAIALSISLALVFAVRALTFSALTLVSAKTGALRKEKALGFWRTGMQMLRSLTRSAMRVSNP